jgi:hypothetical protein
MRSATRLRGTRALVASRIAAHAAVQLRALDHTDRGRGFQRQAPRTGDADQELRIIRRRFAGVQYNVVASLFLELSRLDGGEPHERVIPMHRACQARDLCREVVEPTDMRKLMQQGEATLRLGPVGARGGEQHDRPHESPSAGTRRVLGLEHTQVPAESRVAPHATERRRPRQGKPGPRLASPAPQSDVCECIAQPHDQCADEPDDHRCRPCRARPEFRARGFAISRVDKRGLRAGPVGAGREKSGLAERR